MVREAPPPRTRAHLFVLALLVAACLALAVVPHEAPFAAIGPAMGPAIGPPSHPAQGSPAALEEGPAPAPEDVCLFGHG